MHSTLRQPAHAQPCADNLTYTFSLPGAAYSTPRIRHTVRGLLEQHGLPDLADLGELAAAELLAGAHAFAPEHGVSLSLRFRDGVLRLVLFDQHPDPARCRAERRAQLALLVLVARTCGGGVDLTEAEPPLRGTRVWVSLPREGAGRYGRA